MLDETLFLHGMALAFQLVFLQLWIPVGAHNHWWGARQEMDEVIPGTGWRQSHRSSEHVGELV
jgi:hypothetical protein